MKKTVIIAAAACAAILALSSCAGTYQKGDRMPESTTAQIDTVSYALGMYFGTMITSSPFGEIDLGMLNKGFNDVLNGKETMLTQEKIMNVIQSHLMARSTYETNRNEELGAEFLAANKEKEGVVETESGLQYKIETEGTGIAPAMTDTVEVNYEGRLIDGTVFDSSYERGESTKFPLDRVIKGWGEGLTYIKEGGKIQLYIPSDLAYGSRGTGPIPGNSTLIFDVELIKVYKHVEEENEAETK
ncbi:MAG TPA: FKBP-type peptidyl-prolyl cis-trans isomerase [Candidatus Coprenecus merdigallinarum]|nr:FKBP-type peptidyl-prolyl cis-trans isomerase [Candidatus Coprenecus merdigallinarum]